MKLDTIESIAKSAFGMGSISAVNGMPTPTGNATDDVLKAALQVIIAIVTLITIWKKPKKPTSP